MFNYFTSSPESRPGQNPGLAGRNIPQAQREALVDELQKLEDPLIKDELERETKWYKFWNWFGTNEEWQEFMTDQYLPFYRQYAADKAIAENREWKSIKDDYKDLIDPRIELIRD